MPLTTLSVGEQLGPAAGDIRACGCRPAEREFCEDCEPVEIPAGDTRTDRERLREAVVRGLGALTSVRVNANRPGEVPGYWTGHLTKPETERIADAVLATPELAALLDAAEKAERIDSWQQQAIWVDPARRSGEPCVGGTRLGVDMIIGHVWANGVESAMDMWEIDRRQVLHACWYAGAGYVTRLHSKGGKYVARRGPWRKRWGGWAEQVHADLWSDANLDGIPDPPRSEP